MTGKCFQVLLNKEADKTLSHSHQNSYIHTQNEKNGLKLLPVFKSSKLFFMVCLIYCDKVG